MWSTEFQLVDLLSESASHDEPHHQLYGRRAGFAQIFDVRQVFEVSWIAGERVEKGSIEGLIDEAGPRSL